MTAPELLLRGTAFVAGQRLFGPLDLSVAAGHWTCLLGPSGCGKSTVLRQIAELETGATFEGSVTATDGGPVLERVAYMAQSDLLMPWLDVRDNVNLGARLRGEPADVARAETLIARLGLTEAADRRPSALSGGQRQRVALARTLMEDRPVVLLDEPFSALDARTRAEMQELAAATLAGRTVLMVTHDPAEAARMGDRILLMQNGALIEAPRPDTPAIRAADDPQVLACGAALLSRLRNAA